MKYLLPLLTFLLIQTTLPAQNDKLTDSLTIKVMTPQQMKEDFNFLRRVLQETHPGLYRYNTKKSMQAKMDSIAGLLNKPMAFYKYYQLLAGLISDVRCAHTYIIPKNDMSGYMNEVKTMPFAISPDGNRMYITLNGTTDTTIRPGYEIVKINGRTIPSIRQQLYDHMWADGYNLSMKKMILSEHTLPLFYYVMIEQPDIYTLDLRDLQGKDVQMKIPAAIPGSYQKNYTINPVNKHILSLYAEKSKKDREKGWRLEFPDEPSTALIRITGFGGGSNGKEAAKKMREFMDTNIVQLKEKNIKNLIIDLRYNGGGWDIQGVELLTYLMKDTTPVRYYARKHSITDSSEFIDRYSDLSPEDKANVKRELIPEKDGTFTIKEEYNDDLKLQYAKPSRFTGNVYILVNGASASTTSEFAAAAYSNKIGTFVGDETGGAYEGGNGGSFLHFQLPNSRISLGTPLLYYNNGVKPPKQKGRGVIPDYPVEPTIQDILQGRDAVMEKTLDLIRTKR